MAKRKRHSCVAYCEGRLHGITENLKLRGEISENSKFEIKLLRGLTCLPKDTYVMKCEHGREWTIRDVTV